MKLSSINISQYDVIGFDMDGTLYNELNYISQVYVPIAKLIASTTLINEEAIYIWMKNRWIEKGSSYPYIFEEVLKMCNSNDFHLIEECVTIFRNFTPTLELIDNVLQLLERISIEKSIFIVTDGNPLLQRKKFSSLQLHRWTLMENVVFTGDFDKNHFKPSISAVKHIKCLQSEKPLKVLFFGDREIDRQFAENADFDFVMVEKFNQFWECDE
ncbi:HAD family hydrolase [Candidatus Pristimantibacillus sp. PTI5]|uniref:HAD family hydrolase n=1 Tax=Candidatus Pristimantibacillus sp. PTI5 TaxID=3400422 RepID=UPI003B014684